MPAPRRRRLTSARSRGRGGVGGAFDFEAEIGDHLQVGAGRLPLGGEVVAGKDRVGDHQSQRLQASQVHLAPTRDPDLNVGKVEAIEGEESQTALRRQLETPR